MWRNAKIDHDPVTCNGLGSDSMDHPSHTHLSLIRIVSIDNTVSEEVT
jgi:hypothetical protein